MEEFSGTDWLSFYDALTLDEPELKVSDSRSNEAEKGTIIVTIAQMKGDEFYTNTVNIVCEPNNKCKISLLAAEH